MSLWYPQKLPTAFAKLSKYHHSPFKICDFRNQNCIQWLWSCLGQVNGDLSSCLVEYGSGSEQEKSIRDRGAGMKLWNIHEAKRSLESHAVTYVWILTGLELRNEITFLCELTQFLDVSDVSHSATTASMTLYFNFKMQMFFYCLDCLLGAPEPWPDIISHVFLFFLLWCHFFGDVVFVVCSPVRWFPNVSRCGSLRSAWLPSETGGRCL